MSPTAIQSLIGMALIDQEFCKELLGKKRLTLLSKFDLTDKERETIMAIEADSIQEFAKQLYRWLIDQARFTSLSSTPPLPAAARQGHLDKTLSGLDAFLVESLAHGLLGACGVEDPPVPVRGMLQHSLPIFERLNLLELHLGLYDVAYRSLPNGSRVIVVDLTRPFATQRAGLARELYIAFCRSSRAAELRWPDLKQPNACSDFFARCLMMPAIWVRQSHAKTTPLEDLATRFGVPVQMAAQRLNELK